MERLYLDDFIKRHPRFKEYIEEKSQKWHPSNTESFEKFLNRIDKLMTIVMDTDLSYLMIMTAVYNKIEIDKVHYDDLKREGDLDDYDEDVIKTLCEGLFMTLLFLGDNRR